MGKRSLKGWSHLYAGMQLDLVPQFSHSVVYDFFWPHKLQDLKLPCPSPTPGACSNSSPLSQWCHPTISSPVVPFSSCIYCRIIRCCSVSQSCWTLCSPLDCSTSGFPVLHHPLELAQTQVHWVGDAIQPSRPVSPSLLAFNLCLHQVFSNESVLWIRWPNY